MAAPVSNLLAGLIALVKTDIPKCLSGRRRALLRNKKFMIYDGGRYFPIANPCCSRYFVSICSRDTQSSSSSSFCFAASGIGRNSQRR